MSDEIFHSGNELLPSLIDIWRRKCSDKPKVRFEDWKKQPRNSLISDRNYKIYSITNEYSSSISTNEYLRNL